VSKEKNDMTMTTEQKVGLFFLTALVILAVIIELVENWDPFRKQYAYYTHFKSAIGLKVGDPVRMAGVEVGKIERIGIDGLLVRVDFMVDDSTEIRTDSIALVRQMNMLGGQFLGLDFGSKSKDVLPPNSEVKSKEGTNIDELITSLDKNQKELFLKFNSLAGKIEDGDGVLSMLLNDTELSSDLKSTVRSLSKVASALSGSNAGEDLVATIDNLNAITAGLRNGDGTLGRLMTDDELYSNLNSAFADLSVVAENIKSGKGLLGKLINEDDKTYADLQQTLENLRSISDKINSGEGTFGKLVNDSDLYYDAKTTLNKVEKAADGLSDSSAVSALGTVVGTLF
jgi:phospholipid/cholesterol/gamma-HCH transport system substrate-binding protein